MSGGMFDKKGISQTGKQNFNLCNYNIFTQKKTHTGHCMIHIMIHIMILIKNRNSSIRNLVFGYLG